MNLSHQTMPLDLFREDLFKANTPEKKFDLLRSQFPHDPFTFDLSQHAVIFQNAGLQGGGIMLGGGQAMSP